MISIFFQLLLEVWPAWASTELLFVLTNCQCTKMFLLCCPTTLKHHLFPLWFINHQYFNPIASAKKVIFFSFFSVMNMMGEYKIGIVILM